LTKKIDDSTEGTGTIETYTVDYDNAGKPQQGIIIARTPDKKRFIAKTHTGDLATINRLTNTKKNPIGQKGLSRIENGFNFWKFQ